MAVHPLLKQEGIPVIVDLVELSQCRGEIPLRQAVRCAVKQLQALLQAFLGELDVAVPIDADKGVLGALEQIQQLPLQSTGVLAGFLPPVDGRRPVVNPLGKRRRFVQRLGKALSVGLRPGAPVQVQRLLGLLEGSGKIQRHDPGSVNGHQQQTEQLVVEAVHVLVVVGVVVELGMVVGLHKAAAGEIVDHGGNARDGDGKIVRPGLDGGGNPGLLRVALGQLREVFQKFFQKIHIFVGAADSCPGAVGKGGQLKVQVGNDLPPPLGMHGEHLLVSAC